MKITRELGAQAALVLLCMALWAASPHFATVQNALNILEQTAIIGILAVGMTFVILTGGIDLSVGSLVALTGIVAGLALRAGWPPLAAMAAALLLGAACGSVNGVLITRAGLPPFIATLGMMSVARGASLALTSGRPVSGFAPAFRWLGTGRIASIPAPALLLLACCAAAHVILTRTTLGRYLRAIGGNEDAARMSGVNVRRYKTMAYLVSGSLSAIASLVLVARLDSAQPTAGLSYELDAIAAVVIGGTSLLGGTGSVAGSLTGALLMSVLRNGLNLLDVSAYLQQMAIGIVIVGAVAIDVTMRRRERTHRSRE